MVDGRLLGPLHHGPAEMIDWLAAMGVAVKEEDNGRMFPTTDDSATIIDALQSAARKGGVEVRLRMPVTEVFPS